MRALVTGGSGFIGSHLCENLLSGGWDVVAVDDFSTGKYENVEHLEGKPGFRLVIDTVLNESLMEPLIREADVVFHLASAVGVRLIIEEPVRTIESIVMGTHVVLKMARRYRKNVLITSSSEVYGKGSKIPFSENDDTVQGATATRRWAYANAKAMDEFLAFAHWHETKLPVVCVRLFNTVGPRQTGRYGMVIPTFVSQALKGEQITVYGDGEQSRCFAHVDDVVPALARLILCREAYGKAVNIGSDTEITINKLAEQTKIITGSSSPIVHIPYDEAYVEGFEDMQRRVPDLSLAHSLIAYQPKLGIEDILRSVTRDIKNKLATSRSGQGMGKVVIDSS